VWEPCKQGKPSLEGESACLGFTPLILARSLGLSASPGLPQSAARARSPLRQRGRHCLRALHRGPASPYRRRNSRAMAARPWWSLGLYEGPLAAAGCSASEPTQPQMLASLAGVGARTLRRIQGNGGLWRFPSWKQRAVQSLTPTICQGLGLPKSSRCNGRGPPGPAPPDRHAPALNQGGGFAARPVLGKRPGAGSRFLHCRWTSSPPEATANAAAGL